MPPLIVSLDFEKMFSLCRTLKHVASNYIFQFGEN